MECDAEVSWAKPSSDAHQPISHWLEPSHMATLTAREAGKCSLPCCPGGREACR